MTKGFPGAAMTSYNITVSVWILALIGLSSANLRVTQGSCWPPDITEGNGGIPLSLCCDVQSDHDFEVTWLKDGSSLAGSRFSVNTTKLKTILKVKNPVMADQGTYMCVVETTAAEGDHERANFSDFLAVTGGDQPLGVYILPLSETVKYGGDVNLTCVIQGSTFTSGYEWRHDGKYLNDTHRHEWNPEKSDDNSKVLFGLIIRNITASDLGNYTCHAMNDFGSANATFNLKLRQKEPVSVTLMVILVASSAGIIALTTVTIATCIKKRKKGTNAGDLPWATEKDDYEVRDEPLEYDVFISYSSYDRAWVKDVLLQSLEKEGYRVCIDFKCFMPGAAVVENIMEAIYRSRRTLVVMSKSFLKSVWAQFELDHVQHKLITMKDDSLILIKYDKCQIPRKLLGKTFLDWSDKSVQPHFWDRLFKTLGPERVQFDTNLPAILGLDLNRPSSFEAALEDTEKLRADLEATIQSSVDLSVEIPSMPSQYLSVGKRLEVPCGPEGFNEKEPLLHRSTSSGYHSINDTDNLTFYDFPEGVV